MSLTVGARRNTLVGGAKAVRFHTRHRSIVDYTRLVDIMADARTTLSKPDLVAAVALLTETISSLVADGEFVKTPLGDFYLTAVGTADSESEPFTPRRKSSGHGFRLRFRPDRAVEKVMAAKVLVKRDDEAGKRRPCLDRLIPIRDPVAAGTGEPADDDRNESILVCRGDFARLEGSLLGFEQSDERLGVFFEPLHGAAHSELGVRCRAYASIKPSLVILQVPPELEAGDYIVRLHSATKAGNPLTGRMPGTVCVG